jgi:hypothetical protein
MAPLYVAGDFGAALEAGAHVLLVALVIALVLGLDRRSRP